MSVMSDTGMDSGPGYWYGPPDPVSWYQLNTDLLIRITHSTLGDKRSWV
jgi:hypothetical protein